MFGSNYYCLVAGLREYTLEADAKGFDARAIVSEILEGVSRADARQVRLLYTYYDCEHLAALHAGRTVSEGLGNLTPDELAEELRSPRRLPDALLRSNVNTAPCGVLSETAMLPPCAWTMLLHSASPSPRPRLASLLALFPV